MDFERKRVKAPKLGWVKFHDSRVVDGITVHSMTFSRTPSLKYYVSVLYEDRSEPVQPVDTSKPSLKVAGLDMSLTSFFVDDKGESPQYDACYRKAQSKISELQRRIAATKRACLKKKLGLRLARLHEHVANKRRDFNEKLSTKLVQENDVIVVETLSLKDMARFKTWSEREKSLDKSNHGKSVNDLGWCYFVNRLKAKAGERGKIVVEADKWFASTKTCNVCGYANSDLTLSDRSWICPRCGTEHNRDQNAAVNLRNLALGLFKVAEGDFTGGTPVRAA